MGSAMVPEVPEMPCCASANGALCAYTHLHASMKAEVSGADRGLDFAGAHELDAKSGRQIPAAMIGRLLVDGDIRKLQQAITPKKPASPTVRGRPVPKAIGG